MGVYINGILTPPESGPPSGPAGGVLTGTYPDPVLDVPEAVTELGLGDAAFDDVGTGAGTVAAGNDSRITGAIQSSLLTARGQIIRRGAAAPEAVAMQAINTFGGGDGTDFVPRTAAQVLSATDAARTTTYDFSDATGVTLVNGNGTAAVTGGQVVLTTANGANTSSPNAPTATIALPSDVDGWRGVDIVVRLTSFTGTLGGAANRLWFSVGSVADAPNNAYAAAGSWSVAAYSQPDGTLLVGDQANGSAFTARGTTAAGVLLLDGDDWLRILFRAGDYAVITGRGATRPTTGWTRRLLNSLLAATASATPFSQPSQVTLSGYRNGAQAEAHVVSFDDLSITGLL